MSQCCSLQQIFCHKFCEKIGMLENTVQWKRFTISHVVRSIRECRQQMDGDGAMQKCFFVTILYNRTLCLHLYHCGLIVWYIFNLWLSCDDDVCGAITSQPSPLFFQVDLDRLLWSRVHATADVVTGIREDVACLYLEVNYWIKGWFVVVVTILSSLHCWVTGRPSSLYKKLLQLFSSNVLRPNVE